MIDEQAEGFDRWVDGIGERLRVIRVAQGMSLRTAEERTGVPFTTITRVESAKGPPTLEVIYRLAKGYGATLSAILIPPDEANRNSSGGRPSGRKKKPAG